MEHSARYIVSSRNAGRPVLTHCFAGRIAPAALKAVGLDRDVIVADLRSNDSVPQLRARISR